MCVCHLYLLSLEAPLLSALQQVSDEVQGKADGDSPSSLQQSLKVGHWMRRTGRRRGRSIMTLFFPVLACDCLRLFECSVELLLPLAGRAE